MDKSKAEIPEGIRNAFNAGRKFGVKHHIYDALEIEEELKKFWKEHEDN